MTNVIRLRVPPHMRHDTFMLTAVNFSGGHRQPDSDGIVHIDPFLWWDAHSKSWKRRSQSHQDVSYFIGIGAQQVLDVDVEVRASL